MNLLQKHKDDDDTDIVQSVMYGFGIMAQKMNQEQYQQYVPTVIQTCEALISHKDAEADRIILTETIYGVMGKLCYFHISEKALADKFVSILPLSNEKEEATKVHKLFFQ